MKKSEGKRKTHQAYISLSGNGLLRACRHEYVTVLIVRYAMFAITILMKTYGAGEVCILRTVVLNPCFGGAQPSEYACGEFEMHEESKAPEVKAAHARAISRSKGHNIPFGFRRFDLQRLAFFVHLEF